MDAVRAFRDIGIEIVHRDLWRNSRNLLTRREVGVRRVSVSDIHHCLEVKGYADGAVSSLPVKSDHLDGLWRGIGGVLATNGEAQGRLPKTAARLLPSPGTRWPPLAMPLCLSI